VRVPSAEGFEQPGQRVLLDTSSGDVLHPAARQAFQATLDTAYADPRQVHHPGRTARLVLDNARTATAEALGVEPDEVMFTGSGSDAVARGLIGLHAARESSGDSIVRGGVESDAVVQAVSWAGAQDRVLSVDPYGRVSLEGLDLEGATLVACQTACAETGTRQPLEALAERLGEVPLFVDATASAGRLALPDTWSVAAASAHVWGGPAGVGVLLVRRDVPWIDPFPWDDPRESDAPGLLHVPSVFAAAAALQATVADRDAENLRLHSLVAWIRRVAGGIRDVTVLGDPSERLPHLVAFTVAGADAEALVRALDERGFAVAGSSAPSRVLDVLRVTTPGRLTVSLGRDTTEADVDRFVSVLPTVVADVRRV
jgi:cysteine desulfurase